MYHKKSEKKEIGALLACCGQPGLEAAEGRDSFLWPQVCGAALNLKVDEKNDALYFRLAESAIVDSEEVRSGVILDYRANRNVIAVEILGLAKRVAAEMLQTLQFERA